MFREGDGGGDTVASSGHNHFQIAPPKNTMYYSHRLYYVCRIQCS